MTQARERSVSSLSDAELIEAVRHGSTEAFGVLYERHRTAARRASTYLARSEAEREEVVSEAFARILKVLQAGKGPTEEFRPYLHATMRNIAINTTRQQSPLSLVADMGAYDSPTEGEDPAISEFHREMITRAFTSLPERWRMVLWHTEVEGEPPAAVAPLLGMSPNGVAALAYRAREGLSRAYLQMHLPAEERLDCRASRAKLGGYVRDSLTEAEARRVSEHLDGCERCRALAAGLTEINNDLRGIIGPLVLGIPLAAAYLGTSSAAGTLAAAPAKVAGVGGHAIAKVALVIVAAAAVGGAAYHPDPVETRAVAPAAPQFIQTPRQPVEEYTPTETRPEPAPVPTTTPPPAPPVPVADKPPATQPQAPPSSARISVPQSADDCRPWYRKLGCAEGRPDHANAPVEAPPGKRNGNR